MRGCRVSHVQDKRDAASALQREPLVNLSIETELYRFTDFGGQDGPYRCRIHAGSARIWEAPVSGGYLNAADILDKFDPKNPHFELKVAPDFADLTASITDEISRKVFKNRIVNARDRRELKFRKEVQLGADFQALREKIKHRTRYRVMFETDALIEGAPARIKASSRSSRSKRRASQQPSLNWTSETGPAWVSNERQF